MIVNIGFIAFYLSSLVWIFLYPVLIANFVLGEELRSSLPATKILFGSGAVWWVIALVLVFLVIKSNRDDEIREIKKETRDDAIRGKVGQLRSSMIYFETLCFVAWVVIILAWAFNEFGN
jgi:hypothetical protein